jgi:hypothetical protein
MSEILEELQITREDVINRAAGLLVDEIRAEGVDGLKDRLTLSLGDASQLLGLTRDELKRTAAHLDHGRRNQRITLAEFDRLALSRTVTPETR